MGNNRTEADSFRKIRFNRAHIVSIFCRLVSRKKKCVRETQEIKNKVAVAHNDQVDLYSQILKV